MADDDCFPDFPDEWEAEDGQGEAEEAAPMEEDGAAEEPEAAEETEAAEGVAPAGEQDEDEDVDLDALEAAALSSWQEQSAPAAPEEEEEGSNEEVEEEEQEGGRISISVPALSRKGSGSNGKSGKGKGKPPDGGIGVRVAAINKAGHWPPGKGVDVRALSALRALPLEQALGVIDKLEQLEGSISNPSQWITLECRGASQAAGKGGSLAANAANRAFHKGGEKGAGGKFGGKGKGKEDGGKGKDSGKSGGKGKDGKSGKKGKGKKETKGNLDLHNMVLAPRPKEELPWAAAAKQPVEETEEASDEEVVEEPPTKRPRAVEPAEDAGADEEVEVSPALGRKLEELEAKGIELVGPAMKALAGAEERDALIVCQALTMKGKIDNPSRFVISSLRKRVESKEENIAAKKAEEEAKEEEARLKRVQALIDKVNTPKAGVLPKAPVAKARVVPKVVIKSEEVRPGAPKAGPKVTITNVGAPTTAVAPKAAVAKAPPKAAPKKRLAVQILDVGRAPQARENLDFEQLLVQAHLKALNTSGVWEVEGGDYALDEACFILLLKIPAHRAIEILQDLEEKGQEVKSPLDFVRDKVTEEVTKEASPDTITALGILASLNKGL